VGARTFERSVTLPPFQSLLDAHAVDLHRFLVASVGPHDGADCFQETVISALRAYPRLGRADNLRGWLFTIAHHKVIDHVRRTKRQALPTAEPPDVGHVDGDGPVDRVVDGELWAALRALPPKQRSAVTQRYLLDRPYAEIAQVIGCSEAAARQNVRAGLRRLRQEVTP
jgi:RNA polymerase sigma factor (sigma-70 family)